jgi:COP9 signalosome complex subunit 5
MHARSGGTIEVMGLLMGKVTLLECPFLREQVDGDTMIVMDSFALPVEGTETRVNAHAEGYEYMVEYLTLIRQVFGHTSFKN